MGHVKSFRGPHLAREPYVVHGVDYQKYNVMIQSWHLEPKGHQRLLLVNIFFMLLLVFRVGRQSHRVPYAHHHEERQGDCRYVVGLRRFRQHGARGRHRVRVDAGRKKDYEAGPDPPQWQQHHDGENIF